MDSDTFRCDLVSWEEAYRLGRVLAENIASSGYMPDLVIAIGRGGYVPARVICDFLLHDLLTSIKIEHWGTAAQKRGKATVRFPVGIDIKGLSVLIIDDVTDTGDTLREAVAYIESLGAREAKTGVLQHKSTATFEPDYYAQYMSDWKWIIYPWAVHEDLFGFTANILRQKACSINEIRSELARRYEIVIATPDLMPVLEDLRQKESMLQSKGIYRIEPK
jgi:hypoxanthine phosphoribosyltransferase